MKTEKEIREKIEEVKIWKAEAKRKREKFKYSKWRVVENYLEWVLEDEN